MPEIKLLDNRDIEEIQRRWDELPRKIMTSTIGVGIGSYFTFKGLSKVFYFKNPLKVDSRRTIGDIFKQGRKVLMPIAFVFLFVGNLYIHGMQYENLKRQHLNKYRSLIKHYSVYKVRKRFESVKEDLIDDY